MNIFNRKILKNFTVFFYQPKDNNQNRKMFTNNNSVRTKPKTVFLDVKPSINTVTVRKYSDAFDDGVTTRRDSVVLYGTEGRPSLTSAKSIEVFQKDIFFIDIYPITIYLRAIGVLPVTRPGPAQAHFKFLSASFFYSVLFFVGITVGIFRYIFKQEY